MDAAVDEEVVLGLRRQGVDHVLCRRQGKRFGGERNKACGGSSTGQRLRKRVPSYVAHGASEAGGSAFFEGEERVFEGHAPCPLFRARSGAGHPRFFG